MLTLPESVLLFALDDERGNVRPSAFLGLDEALYAAVLAELMLRGLLRVRSRDGAVRLPEKLPKCDHVMLMLALHAITEGEATTVDKALEVLDTDLGMIRSRITGALASRGVLEAVEVDRALLEDDVVHPAEDPEPEARMREVVRDAVGRGDAMTRREGMLVGLLHCLDLWEAVLPDAMDDARAAGEWVLERDIICRQTQIAVSKARGTWEG